MDRRKTTKLRTKNLKDRYREERKQKHINQWKNWAMAKRLKIVEGGKNCWRKIGKDI